MRKFSAQDVMFPKWKSHIFAESSEMPFIRILGDLIWKIRTLPKILQAWLYKSKKKKNTRLRWPWQQIVQKEIEHDLVAGETLLDMAVC